MTAPQQAFVEAVITHIRATVAGATDWETHRFEPIHHLGNGDHLAVWFDSETNNQAGNTSAASGHLDMREIYGVRFWRQAPEGVYQVVNEDEAGAVLEIYEATMNALRKMQYAGTIQWYVRPQSGASLIGGDDESKVRMFEIVLETSRARGFNG